MSRIPAEVSAEDRSELLRHFLALDAEWIAMSIATMGWLNKTMDALGVPLEETTVAQVISVIAHPGGRGASTSRVRQRGANATD